ncbi:MAG: hypothetical protein ACK4GO_13390 [Gemmobacter sp.]
MKRAVDIEAALAEAAEAGIGALPRAIAESRVQRELQAAVLALVAVDGIAPAFALSELHRRLLGELLAVFDPPGVAAHFRLLAQLIEAEDGGGTAATRALAAAQPMGRA